MLQSGVDALVLSIIPGDVGRPTKRLEKATVRDGSCCWENPVYETVKYFQDPKTGKIADKIYRFLLSTVIYVYEFSQFIEVIVNLYIFVFVVM